MGGEGQGVGIGKVGGSTAVGVAQGAEQEGGVLLRGAGAVGAEQAAALALGQAIVIEILHITVGPGLYIGKGGGVVIGERLGVLLLTQQADQHHTGLETGGGAVELIALVGAAEEAEVLEGVSTVGEISREGRSGQQRHNNGCEQQGFANAFHVVLLSFRKNVHPHSNTPMCKMQVFSINWLRQQHLKTGTAKRVPGQSVPS